MREQKDSRSRLQKLIMFIGRKLGGWGGMAPILRLVAGAALMGTSFLLPKWVSEKVAPLPIALQLSIILAVVVLGVLLGVLLAVSSLPPPREVAVRAYLKVNLAEYPDAPARIREYRDVVHLAQLDVPGWNFLVTFFFTIPEGEKLDPEQLHDDFLMGLRLYGVEKVSWPEIGEDDRLEPDDISPPL